LLSDVRAELLLLIADAMRRAAAVQAPPAAAPVVG
jgi:hypothetical protein